jgi:pimeloyl-ACP methyl ester carboxylesterase
MEGFVDLPDGGRLRAWEDGDGPAVTLLHPGVWDARVWDEQVPVLVAAGFRVIRYDLRGFGASSWPDGTYSDVEDLRALLDQLDVWRTAVVGCSLGGDVAVRFTLAAPERVWALVPVASGLDGFPWDDEELTDLYEPVQRAIDEGDYERAVEEGLRRWAPLGVDDAEGARIRAIALDNARRFSLDESLAERTAPSAYERLEQIDAPTLVLVGDHDLRDIERVADVLATRIPGARKAVVEGADHVVNLRRPRAFEAALLSFLEGVRP